MIIGLVTQKEEYRTIKANSQGIVNWSSEQWNINVQEEEEKFGQDLDGDGEIGLNINLTVKQEIEIWRKQAHLNMVRRSFSRC